MHFNQFELNLLRALDALLSERNVTRAAETLFVTQQAMSGSLHRLRGHFDDPLRRHANVQSFLVHMDRVTATNRSGARLR